MYQSQGTSIVRTDDGGAALSFIAIDGGQPVRFTFIVEEQGKKHILEELAGGIALP